MPGSAIPTLTTPRLILRPPVAADFPAYARLMASPRAAGMGGPFGPRAAWGMFCHDVAQWALFGHGSLMLALPGSGECVGQVGINHGPLFPEKELGWLLYEGQEGRGYATEAARAMRDWAFGTLGLATLVSYVGPGNRRSAAVAERLGAVLDPLARRPDVGDLVYRHSAAPRMPARGGPGRGGGAQRSSNQLTSPSSRS
ncbi:GNAT family N-acetyltransferase [Teichococcus aestuarii]|uniref:GNAT family N-acetyltransferase n=1 Tax=Teichococcus aestuarii TaxID=568898 RepID=A0A2U1V4L0_9PROT|nr:GNAT family N-acetyltransferase [Pseudoroseomonas aestuarii]PWC28860.1 GNAT family N-acetyltransferase [Pseudoroseomonas aestuarii]